MNIVPFRPSQNANTENFSYLESEILGKKGDGWKKIKEKIDKKETMNLDLQQETQAWELRRTGESYGVAKGRRKQTKGRSKNKEWMCGGTLEREKKM